MKLVVISPEHEDARELRLLPQLFAAGLQRYHVRKPQWSRARLEQWLAATPARYRERLVLHEHHELAPVFGLGGVHRRDAAAAAATPLRRPAHGGFVSRSCHDLAGLRRSLGEYDAVFFSPVFSSVSKPGYGPAGRIVLNDLIHLLAHRTGTERRTEVLALGGVSGATAPDAAALGFDGVAALGAIWRSDHPLHAFLELQRVTRPPAAAGAEPVTSPAEHP